MNRRTFKTKKMILLTGMIMLAFAWTGTYAQERASEKMEVPLSDPGKPVVLEAHLIRGSITVKGYSGKTVLIEAVSREKVIKEEKEKAVDEKAKGMKLITASNLGLAIEEKNNKIEIRADSWKRTVDLEIQVPYAASLNLKTMQEGDIKIEKVSGELEVNNLHGNLLLTDVSGTVVAHALHGDVTVTFDKINLDKPHSFSSLNGDLDVTFPANLKADVKLKTTHGNIYSDFDINMKQGPGKIVKDDRKEGGEYKISFEEAMYGTINGGGKEISFNSFHGNIYIRKKK